MGMKRGLRTAVLTAVFCCISVNVFAAIYGGGAGTAGNPYQIWTPAQMNTIGVNSGDWGKCFKLMADIDMSVYTGTQYKIIGNSTTFFTGTFDGAGHKIRNFTYTTTGQVQVVGLFGFTSDATIKNLGLEDIALFAEGLYVGGLVGVQGTNCNITKCYSTGSVRSSKDASYVGGLVGYQDSNSGAIANSYSAVSVTALYSAGGLVGCQDSGLVTSCHSSGMVTAIGDSYSSSYSGGLVGYQNGTILNSYSTGYVSSFKYGGGLVGFQSSNSVTVNSFSTGQVTGTGSGEMFLGGLVGSGGNVVNSFWDTEISGLNYSAGGKGCTTAQMKQSATYIGWNKASQTIIWVLAEAIDYPRLSWENQQGTPLASQTLKSFVPGSGTSNAPYRISTPEHLIAVGLFPDEWGNTKYFCLDNDIDLSDYTEMEINRIGVSRGKPFSGIFDGKGHTIRNLTYITTDAITSVGLFGYTTNATIKNLSLENVTISAGAETGGLVGCHDSGTIINCHVTGSVDALSSSGMDCGGGLVGIQRYGTIMNCTSSASVINANTNGIAGGLVGYQYGVIENCRSTCSVISGYLAGGLAGIQGTGGTIRNCTSAGSVISSSTITATLGGLVGEQDSGTITNCYSSASVTSLYYAHCYAGGLVGVQANYGSSPEIENSYATGQVLATGNYVTKGGLVAYIRREGVINSCFWDTESSGIDYSAGGSGVQGKSTAQMNTLLTFTSPPAGWDFTDETANGTNEIWRMCADGVDYPRLNWESIDGDFACPDGVSVEDLDFYAGRWLMGNCGSTNNYCDRADINQSGIVDLGDAAIVGQNWLKGRGTN